MTRPLTPSTYLQRMSARRSTDELALRVACKTELGVARNGAVVHRIETAVATIEHGRIRYSARWLCSGGSPDIVMLANADAHDGRICPRCLAGVPGCFVYRCFANDGRLLYIGITGRYGARMSQHALGSPWWPEVTDVTREEFPSLTAARAAERLAIETEDPQHNKAWAKS